MILLEEETDKCIADKKTQYLYSFDIFDTLITRTTPTPQGIFSIIQNLLLNDSKYFNIPLYVRECFYNYRHQAELYQYSYNAFVNGYQDCSFDEIYQNFSSNFSLSDDEVEMLKKLEIETEYENLVPIRENINKIKELVANGERVVLISDMYHSSDTIRKWLLKFDNIFENIKIYVSNECKCKKRGGDLYKFVQEAEEVEFCNWQHVGDNIISDIEHAKELGINAIKYEYPGLTSYQKFANDRSNYSISSLLSLGCAKNLRINNSSCNAKYDIGASLTAPILVPYVLWILQESVKKGFKTLYFIARDGYILKEIADFIIKENNIDIKTGYIYGSRLAWQGASFYVDLDNMDSVVKQYGLNPEFLSKILDIDQDILTKYFAEKTGKKNKNLDLQERENLLEELKNDKDFISLIREKNKLKYENLIGYLKQEIDFNEDRFAFVDLSGSGVTQNCLASVINQFDNRAIDVFYLRNGQYKSAPKNVNRYYYILRNDACAMLEILARAPHGQTTGYKYDEQAAKYLPVFDEYDECSKIWDLNAYEQGILDFTKEYLKLNKYKDFNPISMYIPDFYITWLIKYIDKETAEELGTIVYNHAGRKETEFAPKIKRRQALLCFLGLSEIKTDNYKLSVSRSKTSTKNILKLVDKYKNIWQWLIQVHVSFKKHVAYIRLFGIEVSFKKLLGMEEK